MENDNNYITSQIEKFIERYFLKGFRQYSMHFQQMSRLLAGYDKILENNPTRFLIGTLLNVPSELETNEFINKVRYSNFEKNQETLGDILYYFPLIQSCLDLESQRIFYSSILDSIADLPSINFVTERRTLNTIETLFNKNIFNKNELEKFQNALEKFQNALEKFQNALEKFQNAFIPKLLDESQYNYPDTLNRVKYPELWNNKKIFSRTLKSKSSVGTCNTDTIVIDPLSEISSGMCLESEKFHLGVLQHKTYVGNNVFISVDNNIIGSVKKNGYKTFLAFKNVQNYEGKATAYAGGTYWLGDDVRDEIKLIRKQEGLAPIVEISELKNSFYITPARWLDKSKKINKIHPYFESKSYQKDMKETLVDFQRLVNSPDMESEISVN